METQAEKAEATAKNLVSQADKTGKPEKSRVWGKGDNRRFVTVWKKGSKFIAALSIWEKQEQIRDGTKADICSQISRFLADAG